MAKVCGLIHGFSGVGKSPLLDTMPGPRLVLDAEGGTDWTPSRKIPWDPAQPPPVGLLPDDTVVVTVRSFNTMRQVYGWLSQPNPTHEFESVGFDSLTEIQLRCKDDIAVGGFNDQRQWGALLDQMMALVRNYRDLKMHPTKPLNVFIVALSVTKSEQQRADVQGALAGKLPGYMDFVGYLFTKVVPETGGLVRHLLVAPIPGFQAKDRTTRLTARFGQAVVTHGAEGAVDLAGICRVINGEEQ